MITAVFKDDDYARVTGLWQWDYGQILRIEGLHLPTAVEIHFSLAEFAGDAITRVGTTKDGVTEVVIPDSVLENQAAGTTYAIYAWIYLADKTSGETIKRISMQVKCRPKPEPFDAPEDAELFREAIEAVNASADRAEAAREGAEAAKKAAEEAANKIEGEISGSEELAEQVKKDAKEVAQDKQAVSQMVTETTQNVQNAARSAQAAENSSTAAKQAQTAAENAGERAKAAMEATEKDRTEVAENRKAVEQAKEAVAADRRAVENTALQFGQAAQNAFDAVGQAQDAAVRAVASEGQEQTTAVQDVGTQAVQSVETAKTAALQVVTTEGDKQVGRVQDAAAGIVADREQISENKAEIASLRQNKADAIVETVAGEIVMAQDSSGTKLAGLRVFGKSTQIQTTGVNLFPILDEYIAHNTPLDVEKNPDGSISVCGMPNKQYTVCFSAEIINFDAGTYHISGGSADAGNVFAQVSITRFDGKKEYFSNRECVFELGDIERRVSIQYGNSQLSMVNTTIYPMLVKGGVALPWEPYSGGFSSPSTDWEQPISNAGESGSIKVEVTGKNLLPYPYADGMTKTTNGITFTVNADRSITCTGTAINQAFFNLNKQKYTESPVDFNKYYSAVDCRYDHSNNITHISVSKSEGYVNKTIYPMIVKKGETNLEYEPPCTPKILTLATPNGLPGIPVISGGNYTDSSGQQWVCDEIDLGRGKYVQRVEDIKLNGDTKISHGFHSNGNGYIGVGGIGAKKVNGLMSDRYIGDNWSDKSGYFYAPDNKGIIVVDKRFTSLEEAKRIIGVEQPYFLYQLADPIEHDLTPEEIAAYEALHTNYPTTVVSNDAGVHMEVSYVADTRNYIRNLEERLNAKLVNIQSALISQKISGGV